MGTVQIVTSAVFLVMFSISIIAFGISFGQINDVNVSIADDESTSTYYTTAQGDIISLKNNQSSEYYSIINTTIEEGSDSPKTMGAFAITDRSVVKVVNNTVSIVNEKIFGNSPTFAYVFSGLLGLLIFVIGLYVYKTIRGIPD